MDRDIERERLIRPPRTTFGPPGTYSTSKASEVPASNRDPLTAAARVPRSEKVHDLNFAPFQVRLAWRGGGASRTPRTQRCSAGPRPRGDDAFGLTMDVDPCRSSSWRVRHASSKRAAPTSSA